MNLSLPTNPLRSFAAGRVIAALTTLAAALICALAFAPGASADTFFCPPGSAAGQCNDPGGVAIDQTTGDIFVADERNHRINVFEQDGDFLRSFGWGVDTGATALEVCTAASTCQAGISGSGAGQLSGPYWVALDSSGGVYIGTDGLPGASSYRVQKFDQAGAFERMWGWDVVATGPGDDVTAPEDEFEVCVPANGDTCKFGVPGNGDGQFAGNYNAKAPIAVGPGGVVYVADKPFGGVGRLMRFAADGSFVGVCQPGDGSAGILAGLALDSVGDFYLNSGEGIRKFRADCSEYEAPPYPLDPDVVTRALAVDPADDSLYSAQRPSGSPWAIAHYSSTGQILSRFGYGSINGGRGLAIRANTAGESVLFSQSGSEVANTLGYLSLPPDGPIADPGSVGATGVGIASATLRAQINPEGEDTEVHFDYLTEAAYQANPPGDRFAGAASSPTVPLAVPAGREFLLNPAEVQVTGLDPETTYRFRVVAEHTVSGDPGLGTVEGPPFTTNQLQIDQTWSEAVGTDAATLGVEANPWEIAATGYLEYVTEAEFQASGFTGATKAPDTDAGEDPLAFPPDTGPLSRRVGIEGLAPGTDYRYRAVLDNALLASPIEGPAHSFTTHLPQEEISGCPNDELRTGPAAYLPDCRAYELVSPLDKNNGDVLPLLSFLGSYPAGLEQSSTDGERLAYASRAAFADALSAPYTSQYIARRVADGDGQWDASEGWQTHALDPPLGNLTVGPFGANDTQFKLFSPDLCRALLRTVGDAPPDLYGGVEDSPNVFRRSDRLCNDGEDLYEPVTTIEPPDGSLAPDSHLGVAPQGVSADWLTTIYRTEDSLEGTGSPISLQSQPQLYVERGGKTRFACVLPGGSRVSCAGGMTRALFSDHRSSLSGALSADGERVFFSAPGLDPNPIYARSHPLAFGEESECSSPTAPCTVAVSPGVARFAGAAADGSLAVYLTGGGGAGGLFAFEVDTAQTTEIAASAAGVVGMSADATVIYFLSTSDLDGGGPAQAGEQNLYRYERGAADSYRFIATGFSPMDAEQGDIPGGGSMVTLDPMAHTARTSPDGRHLAFTSYGRPTGYDNADAASGQPTAQVYLYDAEAAGGAGRLLCASCNPSGSRPAGRDEDLSSGERYTAAKIPGAQNSLYASRALSENGARLYFEAVDQLLPRDSNDRFDLYQWEAPGAGDCDTDNDTPGPLYSERNDGCISLISSGQGARDVELLDADPTGENVFFSTLAGLLPHDYGLIDVYDARVGGGFPLPPPAEPICAGEGCKGASPAAPAEQGPGTPHFVGPPNPDFEAPGPGRCAAPARAARKQARVARRLRARAARMLRGARRSSNPARSRAARGKARRLAAAAKQRSRAARRQAKRAKRCRRARANAGRRANR